MSALRPDVRAAVRTHLERMARMVLAGNLSRPRALELLVKLVPGLPAEERMPAFESLVEAVVLRDAHGAGQQQVTDALDLLMTGAAR